MSQVAKMYLRGSIKQKIKNLTIEQKDKVEKLILEISSDPLLQPCRTEFSNALARTIGNEYLDRNIGDQDFLITIMRGIVQILCDENMNKEILTDRLQRKRWFQSYIFNYLRQILKENKLPAHHIVNHEKLPADQAAISLFLELLNTTIDDIKNFKEKQKFKRAYNTSIIEETSKGYQIEINILPPINIEKLKNYLSKHNISISLVGNKVEIMRTSDTLPIIKIKKKTTKIIQTTDIDSPQNNEKTFTTTKGGCSMVPENTIDNIKYYLPEKVWPILDIIIEDTRPQEFCNKYGNSKPRNLHIAEFLNIGRREVKNYRKCIMLVAAAIDIRN